mgnify:CR=1 FL=1
MVIPTKKNLYSKNGKITKRKQRIKKLKNIQLIIMYYYSFE